MYRFIESAGNRALDFDPDTRARLLKLAGKTVRLELLGVAGALFFQIERDGVRVHEAWERRTDLTIRGSPLAFTRMVLTGGDADIVESGIQIEGDAALAQQFANLLKHLDIDWEEWLSHYVGDIAAHQAGNILRDLSRWAKETRGTMEQNLAEYLVEESRILAGAEQVRVFLAAVDDIRADVDRLEHRIRRLRRR
jgi:ubiquinone biosynthesis protein UbiJ